MIIMTCRSVIYAGGRVLRSMPRSKISMTIMRRRRHGMDARLSVARRHQRHRRSRMKASGRRAVDVLARCFAPRLLLAEQAVVADAVEAAGEHMDQEAGG